ncbi:MAG: peptidylprolyl isomerase [Kiritimatiellae bacterium]|nr:peptidylprolyl isomerase [Kiritimatiellia bacterium]
MTMMISKFHRLIQSRLLWGAFLVVIIFSFVIWGMMPGGSRGGDSDDPRTRAAGELGGQEISFDEYNAAYHSAYLGQALQYGRDLPGGDDRESQLRRAAWLRLATLREAARLGVSATDDELVAAIRANFSGENGYNPQYYDMFAESTLARLGYTKTQFERHLREEITMQKLALLVGRQAVVTPLELQRTFSTLMDTFTVDYATIAPAPLEKDLAVTEQDARALFDEDPAAFTLPEMRDVSYVAFPVADFASAPAEPPSEDALLDYYEAHIADYTTTVTGEDGKESQSVADFDEVKDSIASALAFEDARETARSAAAEFYYSLLPGGDDPRLPDLAEKAAAAGRQPQSLTNLRRTATPVADAGYRLAAEAFELGLDIYDRAGAPFDGQDAVYVLYLDAIHAPRVPDFDEVKDDALAAAKQKALAAAMNDKADFVKAAAETGIAEGKSLRASLKGSGIPVTAAPAFTGLEGTSSTNAAIRSLVQAVVACNAGDLTDPVPSPDGLLVAHVKARQAADPATFESYSAEMSNVIRGRRAQELFADWQASLLDPANFTDYRTSAADYDEDEGFEEEEAEAAEEAEETDASAAPGEDAPAGESAATDEP